ncbi:MAG: maleylacetoacetate isomerase [Gammaproteobacteria bacterium]|nr:maleylacetoacetate isomerase [Gammaproteobacteria bacterium]
MEIHVAQLSAASYRVRIALQLKQVSYRSVVLSLTRAGGEQLAPEYRSLNPQGLVPTLVDDDFLLTQSLAMVEYLDERYPNPPLLPAAPRPRARARQFAQLIVSDIQSLTGLRVLGYLRAELHLQPAARSLWLRHWLLEGLDALEIWLTAERAGGYCVGDSVTLADVCLIPLLYSVRRFGLSIEDFPRLCEVEATCLALPPFQLAHPDNLTEDRE